MGVFDINFDFGSLEGLIQNHGDMVTHEIGISCPVCRNEDPYASTIDFQGRPAYIKSFACESCQGNGYIYRNARKTKGLVTSINPGNRELLVDGYASPGDAVFSPSLNAGYVGDFDRITFCTTATADNSQVIMRGAATLNENVLLKTDLLPTQDRLWYLPTCAIWCEDANGIVYNCGTDFTFSSNKINWINSPDVGTIYTIKYRATLEWIVYTSPMERFVGGRNLGQKVVLKKKHIHFLNGSNAATPAERSEEEITKI